MKKGLLRRDHQFRKTQQAQAEKPNDQLTMRIDGRLKKGLVFCSELLKRSTMPKRRRFVLLENLLPESF